MTGPLTTWLASLSCSILVHARSYWARFLERTRRPSLSSFCRTSASTWSPRETISSGSDVVADRQLASRDDALGLVADVEQHLVAIDLDHRALDDVAVVELDDRPRHLVLERGAPEIVLGDPAGHVVPFGVEGAHRLLGEGRWRSGRACRCCSLSGVFGIAAGITESSVVRGRRRQAPSSVPPGARGSAGSGGRGVGDLR